MLMGDINANGRVTLLDAIYLAGDRQRDDFVQREQSSSLSFFFSIVFFHLNFQL